MPKVQNLRPSKVAGATSGDEIELLMEAYQNAGEVKYEDFVRWLFFLD